MGGIIQLDTNILIGFSTLGSPVQHIVGAWIRSGIALRTSAVTWMEFWNGPVTDVQRRSALAILEGNVLDFTRAEAEEASRIFNLTGRRRSSQADCMIAATAILAGCPLATLNEKDFLRFVPLGLALKQIE